MKKIILFAAVLLALGVQAQEERRLLTMEEAVLGTGIQVQRIHSLWVEGGSVYAYYQDDRWHHVDARTGKEVDRPTFNESARKDNFRAFTRDGEVWYA